MYESGKTAIWYKVVFEAFAKDMLLGSVQRKTQNFEFSQIPSQREGGAKIVGAPHINGFECGKLT